MLRTVLLASTIWVVLMGCGKGDGPRTHPVTGKVVYKGGGPLAGGSISFTSLSDPTIRAVGEIDNNGNFTLTTLINERKLSGAVEGNHEVSIVPLQGADQSMPDIHLVQSQYKVEPKGNHFTIEIAKGK